jgi:hypothetical protein
MLGTTQITIEALLHCFAQKPPILAAFLWDF